MRNPVKHIVNMKDSVDGSPAGTRYRAAFYKDGLVDLEINPNTEEKENIDLMLVMFTNKTNISGNVITVEEWEAFKTQPWVEVEEQVTVHRGPYEDS